MDYALQLQKLQQVETWRLLFVMGIIVIVVFVFQSSALPYGYALLSLFPSSKIQVLGNNSSMIGESPLKSVMRGNLTTLLNDSNLTDPSVVLGNDTEASVMGKQDEHNNERKGSKNDFSSEDRSPDKDSILENAREPVKNSSLEQDWKSDNKVSSKDVQKENGNLTLAKIGSPGSSSELSAYPPLISPNITLPNKIDANSNASLVSITLNISSIGKQVTEMLSEDDNSVSVQNTSITSNDNSTVTFNPLTNKGWMPPTSISEMNSLLLQSRVSSHSMRAQLSSVQDRELLFAKSQIENAPFIKNDSELYPFIYRNVSMFKRSYGLMENMLKVYIYREGEKPIFHEPTEPILKGIYASEGWFMRLMEGNRQFVTNDPGKAHLFYLPFSSRMLQLMLYVRNSHSRQNLANYLKNYADMIATRYPFWNRTGGADHFFVACHDWAPFEARHHMDNCIKALCNANVARDFRIGKDVTLPETNVHKVENPLRDLGGKPPLDRRILAFFAGGMHGYLRPILLNYWENKDPDMKIFGQMSHGFKGTLDYMQYMKSSKYCICARGHDVNSPRVVEAIFYECVPVFIADNYVPPFFEVLDWEAFSVFVPEKDIPKLKDILLSIPEEKYLEMQLRVKKVQQHFLWRNKPVKYDIFHMILHSVWLNRLNQI